MPKALFSAEEFTPTEFSAAEDKAAFGNHFFRFIESDWKQTIFTKTFYNRLSNCFGHIAHYDLHGFYGTWFYEQLRAMEPFGIGNPVLLFKVRAASIHLRTEKFVTVRQGSHELKVRASGSFGGEELGTALVALNGSSATLVNFVPDARKH